MKLQKVPNQNENEAGKDSWLILHDGSDGDDEDETEGRLIIDEQPGESSYNGFNF